jgi:hypothetical protein
MLVTKELPSKYKQRITLYGNYEYLLQDMTPQTIVVNKYQSICKDNTFLYTYLILFLVEHLMMLFLLNRSNCLLSLALLTSI